MNETESTLLWNFILSLAPMLGTALIPLGYYCLRSHGKEDFSFRRFVFTNRARWLIGAAIMGWTAFMITIFPAVQAVVAGGLGSGLTEAAIGWATGTTLVTLVPGGKV